MIKKSDDPSTTASKLAWKRLTYWILALQVLGFFISGLLLGYSPLAELDSLSAIQMQARRFATVIHGGLAWFFCVLIGHTLWRHIGLAWKWPNKGITWYLGILGLGAVVVLSATGLSLLYGGNLIREASRITHWWLGLTWPVLLLAHSIRMRMGCKSL